MADEEVVWIVSNEQLLAWVQNPAPVSPLNSMQALKPDSEFRSTTPLYAAICTPPTDDELVAGIPIESALRRTMPGHRVER
ncbi:hypothetical protein MIND_00194900 [Mycena indigotica]|uniref:Uncharacterized protein n=1 Tax=Mycena indigotica TaxID=2126181 RepID=A0A8H6T7M8_9AGAR|nr:uncharacterized protein MIND_00194900 [Mycena indigotica]KAF7311842.1 hypothetical protein MIND_00194900 [Mycena indigotica]